MSAPESAASDSPSEKPEPAWRTDPWRLFAVLPGVVAVGLAVLYGVGAIQWVAEINGADLAIFDVMPLIPLEQILAKGVGTLAFIGGVTLIAAPLLWWVAHRLRTNEDQRASRRQFDSKKRSHRMVLGLIVPILIALLTLTVPPVILVGLTAALIVVTVLVWRGTNLDVPVRQLTAYFAVGGLALALAYAFFDPGSLPPVRVTVEDGVEFRGRLIATTGDTWYVTATKSGVIAIPADNVIRSHINAQGDHQSSTFGDLFGTEPLGGPFD